MNIVFQTEQRCSFFSALANVLSLSGNNIAMWDSNQKSVYEMIQEISPDLLFISNTFPDKYFKEIERLKYITYDTKDKSDKALLNISNADNKDDCFADLLSYKESFINEKFGTDVLISSNFVDRDIIVKITKLADNIFNNTNFTLKICGMTAIKCPYFTGISTPQEFTSIAKGSKIVIANNNIEKYSLMYNGVYSCTIDEVTDEELLMVEKEKLRKQTIKRIKKDIIENKKMSPYIVMKIFKTIGMNEECSKIEQTLGKIL